jgi:hypothetical protein
MAGASAAVDQCPGPPKPPVGRTVGSNHQCVKDETFDHSSQSAIFVMSRPGFEPEVYGRLQPITLLQALAPNVSGNAVNFCDGVGRLSLGRPSSGTECERALAQRALPEGKNEAASSCCPPPPNAGSARVRPTWKRSSRSPCVARSTTNPHHRGPLTSRDNYPSCCTSDSPSGSQRSRSMSHRQSSSCSSRSHCRPTTRTHRTSSCSCCWDNSR